MLDQAESLDTKAEKVQKIVEDSIKISSFKKGMPELVQLYKVQKDAAEDFAASVKSIAEMSGLRPAVIRKAVKAKVEQNAEGVRYEAEQLLLALD